MNGDCHSAPLVVVHHSFVWDQPTFLAILSALFEQPKGFVERVVVASIESNFKPVWDSEEKYPLSSRIQPSCSIYNFPSNIKETRQSGTPFFVTLPNPTALSVTARVNFAPPLDSETPQVAPFFDPNIEEYNPHLRRPITILLDANLDRKGGGGKIMQCWIRSLLHSKLVGGGGTCEGSVCSLCHESEASTSVSCKDRWPLNTQAKFWELMVASTFCMEPAGDTMTRSHFYAAVLSGCIPVIFDGGVDDFHEDDTTCWAWRGNGLGSTLKYSDFAVIYNATAVRDGSVDVVKELSEMPVKFPSKLLSLRRGLDRAAAAMRYSASSSEEPPDAFDTFINFLQVIKGSL
jgi:hypothetical protein